MEGDNQNFWYVIPSELAEKGKPLKALLFGLISSLCNKSGVCFASNKYLANKLGFRSERTVSQYINELIKEKYLTSQIDKQSGNSRVLQIAIASERARYSVETRDPYSVETLHSNKSISNKREYIYSDNTLKISELLGIEPTEGIERYVCDVFKDYRLKEQTIECRAWYEERRKEVTALKWMRWIRTSRERGQLVKKVRE